ncbi:MAG: transposase [Oscillospiraceae bacterium]|nr:transposase [Oscillospiraceae bacterium]
MEDIQRLFKETIAEFMDGSLDAELEEMLGYGRCYHAARTESGTTNSRNGHIRKTLKTSAGMAAETA